LITDDSFRRRFLQAPERTLERSGLRLTVVELASLRRLEASVLTLVAETLDDRIRRADHATVPDDGD
jgi:hypothetical protein